MSFCDGFEKEATFLGKARKIIKKTPGELLGHLRKHRKDYLMGASATGALGTAYGANRKPHEKVAVSESLYRKAVASALKRQEGKSWAILPSSRKADAINKVKKAITTNEVRSGHRLLFGKAVPKTHPGKEPRFVEHSRMRDRVSNELSKTAVSDKALAKAIYARAAKHGDLIHPGKISLPRFVSKHPTESSRELKRRLIRMAQRLYPKK